MPTDQTSGDVTGRAEPTLDEIVHATRLIVSAYGPTDPVPTVTEIDLPMVIQLKTGCRPLTHNDRLHHHARARHVKDIRRAAYLWARSKLIPAADHITVQLHYAPGDRRSVTDAPNLTATSKPAIDGLIDAGIVPNDDDQHVTEVMPVIHPGPGKRRLWLEITPTEER